MHNHGIGITSENASKSTRENVHDLRWISSPTRGGIIHRKNTSSGDGVHGDEDELELLPVYSNKQRREAHTRLYSWTSWTATKMRRPRMLVIIIFITLIGLLWGCAIWMQRSSDVLAMNGPHGHHSMTADVSADDLSMRKTMLDLDPRPVIRKPSGRKDERYMAYFPHSGYHNQRISLENALVIAKMLDRTLLIPPVWLGHSIPYISFDKLYDRVLQARKTGLEHCKDIEAPSPIPHECLGGYWDYTIVSWDFLVDMQQIAGFQPIVERWDTSYEWLQTELGIDPRKDMAIIRDSTLYEHRYYDTENDTAPLDKFSHRINIPTMKTEYEHVKLLHFGTLFGTTRVRLQDKENYKARSLARASMVFKNEYLDKISNVIKDRMGGGQAYFGLHMRLGDGVFRDNALKNAKKLFEELCGKKLGIRTEIIQSLLESGDAGDTQRNLNRRASHSLSDQPRPQRKETVPPVIPDTFTASNASEPVPSELKKRKIKEDPHNSLPPLQQIHNRAESPLHPSLSCRGPLHTSPALLPLNTPIYIATDSSIPDKDPSLRFFFDTFPCIFTLADLSASKPTLLNSEPIQEFEELNRLRNAEDHVPLAGFFYPLLDAMVASKGRDMLGTPGSTFSQFAVDVLHRVYHDWPIVERG